MPPAARFSDWKLVIHGGAGKIERGSLSAHSERVARAALDRALEAGSAILSQSGGALDAVEAAVRVLEDDPAFNAGRGGALTIDGTAALDASIMDGRARSAGAVAGVTRTRNPVSLARAVMERSPYVMLSAAGADLFSREHGLEQVEPGWFVTAERQGHIERVRHEGPGWYDAEMKYGTVGAVARDAAGHVAAATSTGGTTAKRWGRLGDSPVIGAGTYADDRAGAVSATGTGEIFLRVGAAHEICARMRMLGEDAATAADAVIAEVGALGGTGGVIFVAPSGDAGWSFNAAGMYRGIASATDKHVVIYGDE